MPYSPGKKYDMYKRGIFLIEYQQLFYLLSILVFFLLMIETLIKEKIDFCATLQV
jgi:hypothetical protein